MSYAKSIGGAAQWALGTAFGLFLVLMALLMFFDSVGDLIVAFFSLLIAAVGVGSILSVEATRRGAKR